MTVADVLVRGGAQVTLAAAATADLSLRGSRGIPLAADVLLSSVQDDAFDLVYTPGGMGCAEACRDDPLVQRLLADRLAGSGDVAMICASPIALLPNQLCQGRRLTSYPTIAQQWSKAVRSGLINQWWSMGI